MWQLTGRKRVKRVYATYAPELIAGPKDYVDIDQYEWERELPEMVKIRGVYEDVIEVVWHNSKEDPPGED